MIIFIVYQVFEADLDMKGFLIRVDKSSEHLSSLCFMKLNKTSIGSLLKAIYSEKQCVST